MKRVQAISSAVALLCCGATLHAAELTREQLIESAIQAIKFIPAYGEVIQEEDQDAIVRDLLDFAASLRAIPDTLGEIPDDAARALLRRELLLISPDREYCKSQFEAHLFSQWATVERLRATPRMSAAQRDALQKSLESLVERVRARLAIRMQNTLRDETIDAAMQQLREQLCHQLDDPISAACKQLPADKQLAALQADLDELVDRACADLLGGAETPPSAVREMLGPNPTEAAIASWVTTLVVRPAQGMLAKALAAPPIPGIHERIQGFSEAQARATRLESEIVKRANDKRQADFLAAHERGVEAFREKLRRRQEHPGAGATQPSRQTGEPSDPLRAKSRREGLIELPGPSTQPATRPASGR